MYRVEQRAFHAQILNIVGLRQFERLRGVGRRGVRKRGEIEVVAVEVDVESAWGGGGGSAEVGYAVEADLGYETTPPHTTSH